MEDSFAAAAPAMLRASASMPTLGGLRGDASEALDWRLSVMQQLLLHGSTNLQARQAAAEQLCRAACLRWIYHDEICALRALAVNRGREKIDRGGINALLPARRRRMVEALATMMMRLRGVAQRGRAARQLLQRAMLRLGLREVGAAARLAAARARAAPRPSALEAHACRRRDGSMRLAVRAWRLYSLCRAAFSSADWAADEAAGRPPSSAASLARRLGAATREVHAQRCCAPFATWRRHAECRSAARRAGARQLRRRCGQCLCSLRAHAELRHWEQLGAARAAERERDARWRLWVKVTAPHRQLASLYAEWFAHGVELARYAAFGRWLNESRTRSRLLTTAHRVTASWVAAGRTCGLAALRSAAVARARSHELAAAAAAAAARAMRRARRAAFSRLHVHAGARAHAEAVEGRLPSGTRAVLVLSWWRRWCRRYRLAHQLTTRYVVLVRSVAAERAHWSLHRWAREASRVGAASVLAQHAARCWAVRTGSRRLLLWRDRARHQAALGRLSLDSLLGPYTRVWAAWRRYHPERNPALAVFARRSALVTAFRAWVRAQAGAAAASAGRASVIGALRKRGLTRGLSTWREAAAARRAISAGLHSLYRRLQGLRAAVATADALGRWRKLRAAGVAAALVGCRATRRVVTEVISRWQCRAQSQLRLEGLVWRASLAIPLLSLRRATTAKRRARAATVAYRRTTAYAHLRAALCSWSGSAAMAVAARRACLCSTLRLWAAHAAALRARQSRYAARCGPAWPADPLARYPVPAHLHAHARAAWRRWRSFSVVLGPLARSAARAAARALARERGIHLARWYVHSVIIGSRRTAELALSARTRQVDSLRLLSRWRRRAFFARSTVYALIHSCNRRVTTV